MLIAVEKQCGTVVASLGTGDCAGTHEKFQMRSVDVQHWPIYEHVAARKYVALAGHGGWCHRASKN